MTEPTPAPDDREAPAAAASEPAATAPDTAPGSEPVTPVPVPAPGRPRPARPAILGYLGVAILGIVIGGGAVAIGTGAIGTTPSPSPAAVAAANAVGAPDAPVTVEVWADYQCPFCRLEGLLFGGAMEREYVLPGVVRVVYRDFAFLGQESIDAAVAARCAGRQDAAAQLRFHDALYVFQQGENQGRFVRANLVELARVAGVGDDAAFTACLDDPAVAAEVAAETTAGRNVGVSSTPTLRLRGPGGERVLTGFSQAWPNLRDAIEAVRVAAPSPGASGSPAPSGSSTQPGASDTPAP